MKLHLSEFHGSLYLLPYLCYQQVTFGRTYCHSMCIGWFNYGLSLDWGMQPRKDV